MIIARYADDCVAGFEHRDDAERFLRELKERFRGFELEVNGDKPRLLEFGRNVERNRRARRERRAPGTGVPTAIDLGSLCLPIQTGFRRLRAPAANIATLLRGR